MVDRNIFYGHPGPIPYNTAFFILGNRRCTRTMHFPQAPGAIITHTGEDHTNCIRAGALRNRAKQHFICDCGWKLILQ